MQTVSLAAMTDAELVALAKGGEQDAVGELYERYFDQVYDFLLRTLRSREAAEDATQDAFIRAFRALPTLQEEGRFKAWLFSIAHNTALNNLRKTKRETTPLEWPQDEERGLVLDVIDNDRLGDPEEAALLSESSAFVWEAAKGLDERQYTVIDLHLRRGLESPEIGFALGVSRNNAAVILNRAKASLRDATTALLMLRLGRRECAALDGELLRARVDQLSPEARKVVDRHAKSCADCQATRSRFASPEAVFTYLSVAPAAMGMKAAFLLQLLNAVAPAAAGSTAAGAGAATGVRPEAAAGGAAAGPGTTVVAVVAAVVAAGIAAAVAAFMLLPSGPAPKEEAPAPVQAAVAAPSATPTAVPTATPTPAATATVSAATPPAAQAGGGPQPVVNQPAANPPPPSPSPSTTATRTPPSTTVPSATPAATATATPVAAPPAAVILVTPPILPEADLSVQLQTPAQAIAGDRIVYSFVVRNGASVAVSGARLRTAVSAGLDGVRWACVAENGSSCPAAAADGDFDGLLGLAAGQGVTVTVSADVPPGMGTSATLSGGIELPTGWIDPVPANNGATAVLAVGALADIALGGSMPPVTVPGFAVSHTFVITNAGPSVSAGVVFEYAITGNAVLQSSSGPGLQLAGDDGPGGPATRAQAGAPQCTIDGRRATCRMGSLDPGDSVQVRLLVTLRTAGPFSVEASVLAATPDPAPGNNVMVLGGTVFAPDLAAGSAASAAELVRGVPAPIKVVVRNDGKDPTSGPVTLRVEPPAGLIVESASGDGWSCAIVTGTHQCNRADIAGPGEMFPAVTFVVRPGEDAPDTVSAVFRVAGGQDTDASNNALAVNLKVVSRADLKVAFDPEKAAVAEGETVKFGLRLTNGGPSVSHDAVLAVDVSAGLKLATLPEGCAPVGGGFTCAISKIAAGETLELVFEVTAVEAGESGVAAKVSAKTPDADESNNTAEATIEVSGGKEADLSVELVETDEEEEEHGDVSFRITARNGGPLATNVTLEVLLTKVALDGGHGCKVIANDRLSCPLGVIEAGRSRELTLRGSDGGGEFGIEVIVTGEALDPNPQNNRRRLVCIHDQGCR